MKIIMLLAAGVVANIAGWGAIILAIVNFLWHLVKDEPLFSWWVVVYMGVASVVSLFVALYALLTR